MMVLAFISWTIGMLIIGFSLGWAVAIRNL